ncbi:MAG: hypothetical protein BWY68_00087 [bacterium ADurb.Bin400]|nr:MAG: hypothetical protein BWY68_00087 [bacterium ADurb.Bin400]
MEAFALDTVNPFLQSAARLFASLNQPRKKRRRTFHITKTDENSVLITPRHGKDYEFAICRPDVITYSNLLGPTDIANLEVTQTSIMLVRGKLLPSSKDQWEIFETVVSVSRNNLALLSWCKPLPSDNPPGMPGDTLGAPLLSQLPSAYRMGIRCENREFLAFFLETAQEIKSLPPRAYQCAEYFLGTPPVLYPLSPTGPDQAVVISDTRGFIARFEQAWDSLASFKSRLPATAPQDLYASFNA